jgi:hypothetical protein
MENKETLEEAAEKYVLNESDTTFKLVSKYSFKDGAKWQAERMYSEEELLKILESHKDIIEFEGNNFYHEQWFEQFKKK